MKLTCCTQFNPKSMLSKDYDIVICACGYEARSIFFASSYQGKADHKIAFAFGDRKLLSRTKNESELSRLGFTLVEMADDYIFIGEYISELCKKVTKEEVSVAVDYSCMTKTMYASIINFFRFAASGKSTANIDFVYSLATYNSHYEAEANVIVGPIPGYTRVTPPSFPNALILGLGCEKGRAYSLLEYIDPAVTFVCYSDPVVEPRYLDDIFEANDAVLAEISPDKVFTYPISDFVRMSLTLSSLIVPLKKNHRVILAPLGPKPFTLACLVQAIVNPEVDVWRISGGVSSTPIDVEAAGGFISCNLGFTA